jgi:hypothetical protein
MFLGMRKGFPLVLALALILIPIRMRFLGEWTVRVEDENGIPLAGIAVDESWRSYTFIIGGYSSLRTGPSGIVVFPPVARWRPLAVWAVSTFLARINVHGSWGHSGGSVRVFDDAVESSPGAGAGTNVCSNKECESPRQARFRVYLSERSESSTREFLQLNQVVLQELLEDWVREKPTDYFSTYQPDVSYRWGSWEILRWPPGREQSLHPFDISKRNHTTVSGKAESLDQVTNVMGSDGRAFLLWVNRTQSLRIYSIKQTEGGAVEVRLAPGGHGLYYAPREANSTARAYLISLGPTGDRESKLGVMKQLSDNWFYFADFRPVRRRDQ